ncbi:MAG TPA: hypothetical protein VH253_17990 [Phycisphaerae bacterium]|nr:hypothetical protein [Phycisphaerae bacterium]
MDQQIPDRYAHNPMLAVVENFILDALGLLPPDKAALLNDIVCRTFGGNDWRAAIRRQFDLPDDTDDTLRRLWKQRTEQADAEQTELTPETFARQLADQLFDDGASPGA